MVCVGEGIQEGHALMRARPAVIRLRMLKKYLKQPRQGGDVANTEKNETAKSQNAKDVGPGRSETFQMARQGPGRFRGVAVSERSTFKKRGP